MLKGKKWEILRNKIIQRDKWCVECYTKDNLQVHHINQNKEDAREVNLVTLCKSCHIRLHGESKRSAYEAQGIQNFLRSCVRINDGAKDVNHPSWVYPASTGTPSYRDLLKER